MEQDFHIWVSGGGSQCALNISQAEERRYQHTESQGAIDEDGEHD